MIDKQKVGVFALDAIDSISANFDQPVETGELMLIAEVRRETPDGAYSHIMSYCSDDRAWVQIGMLRAATLAAEERP